MWEAHCDAIFNQIPMDMTRLATFSKKDLIMEMSRHRPPNDEGPTIATIHWSPQPQGCIKINDETSYKEDDITLATLVMDELGKVQGMWFEKAKLPTALAVEAKAIYKACQTIKSLSYLKVFIKSDCKILVDVILGFTSCPWSIFVVVVEDIKLFLDDFPHVSIFWISRLGNRATHECAN